MLESIRVLDLTDERGFLAGKILGDLGADVIKVEPPGGDPARRRGPFLGGVEEPERALGWLAQNTSKRGIVLDLDDESDRDRFRALAATADVVIDSFAPGHLDALGIGADTLRDANPTLVTCSITPYGSTGPRAHLSGHDLVVVAMGGNAIMTGDPDRAPLRCSMPTSHYHAAPEAALGVLVALHARARTGRGDHVDVSMQECQLATLITAPAQYALNGRARTRAGARTGPTREIWETKDGFVSFGLRGGTARVPGLRALTATMADAGMAPAWLVAYDWDRWDSFRAAPEEIERLEKAVGAYFRTRTMRELYDLAVERRIMMAPCNDARAILDHPQLRARDFFTTVEYPHLGASLEHPAFFGRTDDGAIRIRSRAPRIGEHQDEVLGERRRADFHPPLRASGSGETKGEGGTFADLKVLEFGSGAAGPVATRYFAEQGATVIRIESTRRPDFLRALYVKPSERNDPRALDRSPMFALLNAGKQSVTINTKDPRGAGLVRRLVAWADVVAENFTPGVMDRWGLGWSELSATNPRLVMVSGCLFGQTGPRRDYPGFGGQGAAIAGFNHVTGWPDREAIGPYATITDSLAPRYVAVAIAAALLERDRTGRGRHVDLSQIETGVYSLSEMIVRESAGAPPVERMGNRAEDAAPHYVYPCAGEDRWIAIAVRSDDAWRALVREMGEPTWAAGERFATVAGRLAAQDQIDAALARWTAGFAPHALMERLQAAGVEAGVVQTFDELLADPQLAHRGHFQTEPHAVLGELSLERSGIRFGSAPGGFDSPGPLLGEHNEAVLRDLLGLEAGEIASLTESGVVG